MSEPASIAQEISEGRGLYLAAAARLLPKHRQDRPVAPSTLFRWIRDGIRLENGESLRLEAVLLQGRYVTTKEAIARFLERQSPVSTLAAAPTIRTPTQRAKAQQRANKSLDAKYKIN